jgi:hypothetical protein
MEEMSYSAYIYFEAVKFFWFVVVLCVVWWIWRNWRISEKHKFNRSYCFTPPGSNRNIEDKGENFAGDPTSTTGFTQGIATPDIQLIGGTCTEFGDVLTYPSGIAINGELCTVETDEAGYNYYLTQSGDQWDCNFISQCLGYNEGSGDSKGQEYWNNATEGW